MTGGTQARVAEPRHCDMDACHICTGCVHGRHGECGQTVTCPSNGNVNRCRCCGGGRRG